MFGIGIFELLLILCIILLIFGANKLPNIARAFGGSVTEFKKATKESKTDKKNHKKNFK